MNDSTAPEKRLNRNILANFIGQFVSASMAILFVPGYVKILGIESYGLIGFYTIVQMFLTVLEMGVYPVLGRQLASFTAGQIAADRIRDIFWTYLVLTVVIGACLMLMIWSLSSYMASAWFNLSELDPGAVSSAISMIGVVVLLRLVEVVFRSSILGLQKQVIYNVVFSLAAILRYGGVIVFLLLVDSTIEAFFEWQIVVSALALGFYAAICLKELPRSPRRSRFSFAEFASTRRFAAGTVLITLLAVCLRQFDKVYLTKTIDLSEFGYYSFASLLAGLPVLMIGPLYQAYYPRFVELYATSDELALRRTYMSATMFAAIICVTSGAPLIFFSKSIVWVWSGDAELADGVSTYARVLVLGGMVDSMLLIPYCAQIAYGWTRLAIWLFSISLCLSVVSILITVPIFGPLAAAWSWVGVNVFLLLLWVPLMNRRILRGTTLAWYVGSVSVPLTAGVVVSGSLARILPDELVRWQEFLWLALLGFVLLVVVSVATLLVHRFLKSWISEGKVVETRVGAGS